MSPPLSTAGATRNATRTHRRPTQGTAVSQARKSIRAANTRATMQATSATRRPLETASLEPTVAIGSDRIDCRPAQLPKEPLGAKGTASLPFSPVAAVLQRAKAGSRRPARR
ncbi:MAG: hypothetical protein IPK26_25820 [Planctomycetes bacterium]|nr:hypothetical protein [Planctomycetota bacterium]